MIQGWEAILLENGIDQAKLFVFDHNERAIALYNKMGYEIKTTDYIDDQPIGYHTKKNLTQIL